MSSALCDCSPPAPFVRHNKRTRRCRLQLGCRSKVALGSIGTVWRTSTITFDFGWRSEVGSIALVQPVAVACGNLFVDRDESFRETTPLQTRFYFSGVIISFCNLVLLNFLAKANSRYFNDPSTSRGSIIIYDFSLNFPTISNDSHYTWTNRTYIHIYLLCATRSPRIHRDFFFSGYSSNIRLVFDYVFVSHANYHSQNLEFFLFFLLCLKCGSINCNLSRYGVNF